MERVNILGFYDDVVPLSRIRTGQIGRSLPLDEQAYMKSLNVPSLQWRSGFYPRWMPLLGKTHLRRQRPDQRLPGPYWSQDDHPIHRISQAVSMRLVPKQDPAKIVEARHSKKPCATAWRKNVKIEFARRCGEDFPRQRCSPRRQGHATGRRVPSRRALAKPPTLIREGGTASPSSD